MKLEKEWINSVRQYYPRATLCTGDTTKEADIGDSACISKDKGTIPNATDASNRQNGCVLLQNSRL